MKYFADSVIHPQIAAQGYRSFCEIGASYGENTDRLLELPSVRVTIIDPCLDTDLETKYADHDNVRVHKGLSLEMLPTVAERFDCVLIDGDHNWFTVFNELEIIQQRDLLKPGGTIFLHDVGYPYGRRDMYYQPGTVPAEFVQPHAQKGIVPGRSLLADGGGNNGNRFNALREGGPRNGVLTAVEDFMAAHPGEYLLTTTREQHGLGILFRRKGTAEDRSFLQLRVKVQALQLAATIRRRKKRLLAAALVTGVLLGTLRALLRRQGRR